MSFDPVKHGRDLRGRFKEGSVSPRTTMFEGAIAGDAGAKLASEGLKRLGRHIPGKAGAALTVAGVGLGSNVGRLGGQVVGGAFGHASGARLKRERFNQDSTDTQNAVADVGDVARVVGAGIGAQQLVSATGTGLEYGSKLMGRVPGRGAAFVIRHNKTIAAAAAALATLSAAHTVWNENRNRRSA